MIFILTRKKKRDRQTDRQRERERERERERGRGGEGGGEGGHDIPQNVLSIKYTNRKYAHRTRCRSKGRKEREIGVQHRRLKMCNMDFFKTGGALEG